MMLDQAVELASFFDRGELSTHHIFGRGDNR